MSSTDAFWICSSCTWVNKNTESSCKACGNNAPQGTVTTTTPAPTPVYAYHPPVTAITPSYADHPYITATSPPVSDVPAELWVCSKCTWVNKNTQSSCKACGLNAPPGTVIVAPTPVTAQAYSQAYVPATPAHMMPVHTPAHTPPVVAVASHTQEGFSYSYPPSTPAPVQSYSQTYAPAIPAHTSIPTPVATHGYSNMHYAPSRPVPAPIQPTAPPPAYTTPVAAAPGSKPLVSVQQRTDDFVTGFASHGRH